MHELPFFLTDDTGTDTGNRDARKQSIYDKGVYVKGTNSYLPQGLVREWTVSCQKEQFISSSLS